MPSNKRRQIAQILFTGAAGDGGVQAFTPPTPDQIQQYGSLTMQLLVTVVSIWAAIRKALQKPVKIEAAQPDATAA